MTTPTPDPRFELTDDTVRLAADSLRRLGGTGSHTTPTADVVHALREAGIPVSVRGDAPAGTVIPQRAIQRAARELAWLEADRRDVPAAELLEALAGVGIPVRVGERAAPGGTQVPATPTQTWTITTEITVTDPAASAIAHTLLDEALESAVRRMDDSGLDTVAVIERCAIEVRRDSDPGAWTKTVAQEVIAALDERKAREKPSGLVALIGALAEAGRAQKESAPAEGAEVVDPSCGKPGHLRHCGCDFDQPVAPTEA